MRFWITLAVLALNCASQSARCVAEQNPGESTQATVTVLDAKSGNLAVIVANVELTDDGVSRTEDMEIMRQLLHDVLKKSYQWPNSVIHAHQHVHQSIVSASSVQPPEAAYLDDYGVVFQATAPPLRAETSSSAKDTAKPGESLDPWQRTRRELRGERTAQVVSLEENGCQNCHSDKTLTVYSSSTGALSAFTSLGTMIKQRQPAPTREQLTDALLAALAEHGHRVRGLEQHERLTVAVTLRQDQSAAQRGQQTLAIDTTRATVSPYVARLDGTGTQSDARIAWNIIIDQSSSGDLHLRQGNYNKAAKEYVKALNKLVDGNPYEQENVEDNKAISLYKKLIQAHVGASELDQAHKLLELIERSKKESQAVQLSLTMTAEHKMSLPGRLVVSATKAHLDQVAAGELSIKEFREHVFVRYSEPRPLKQAKVEARLVPEK